MKRPDYIGNERVTPLSIREYIEYLEAPYRLTEDPPTEPGWYWVKGVSPKPAITKVYTADSGRLFSLDFGHVDKFTSAQWSSVPLPIPEDEG